MKFVFPQIYNPADPASLIAQSPPPLRQPRQALHGR
jgi:hypothetical protein